MKNKKGDVLDSLSLIIVVTILAIGLFIMAWTIPSITGGLRSAGLNNSVEGTNAINQLENMSTTQIPNGFFWLFIGLCIAQLISAFYLDTHPIWLWLYVIFLGITIIIGAYMGNLYQQITTNGAFTGFSLPIIDIVMHNIIKIVVVVTALSFIIIFSKWAYFSGGQRI